MTEEKLVPELRFPEFSGEWEKRKLGEIATISNKKYDLKSNKDMEYSIEMDDLESCTGNLISKTKVDNLKGSRNYFKENQVLFGKLRPYLKKYYYPRNEGICSTEIWVLFGIGNIKNLYYLIQTSKFINSANISTGTRMPRADWAHMKNIKYQIPSTKEQNKIANFLSLIDKKLKLQKEKIEELANYKKAMIQRIFDQEIRFKDENGDDYPDWEEKQRYESFWR